MIISSKLQLVRILFSKLVRLSLLVIVWPNLTLITNIHALPCSTSKKFFYNHKKYTLTINNRCTNAYLKLTDPTHSRVKKVNSQPIPNSLPHPWITHHTANHKRPPKTRLRRRPLALAAAQLDYESQTTLSARAAAVTCAIGSLIRLKGLGAIEIPPPPRSSL